jgi:hypothetical protein
VLNVHGVHNVREEDIQTAEPLVPESSLLSTAYKIVSNILLARLTPYVSYVNEVIGDHHCKFCCNRSTTDQIFYIWQILEKKWEYNVMVLSAIYRPQEIL